MFGALSILYLSVFAFFGDRANFVSSVDSELCDVALKSMENRLRLFKSLSVRALFHQHLRPTVSPAASWAPASD